MFLNSGAGLAANPEWSAYAASKFGLRAVADSLRDGGGAAGVRVTSVYLGRTATPMQAKVHEQEGKDYDAGDWAARSPRPRRSCTCSTCRRTATIPDIRVRPRPR